MSIYDQQLPMMGTNYAYEYLVDAGQRSILYWDIMRQRGNQYLEHQGRTVPHVLDYEVELIMNGRKLENPVNYGLVKIIPPKGVEIDARKRPFVIVDPRAGHGPGIGGFKADSEIGVALGQGHPCYFIGFSPVPEPGQTIEKILHAEAQFIRRVGELHPDADGKPIVIGNCQAGWAVLMLASAYPEPVRADHRGRRSGLILGRGARREPHAIYRRYAGRQLADRLDRRCRRRIVRRCLAGHEHGGAQSGQHLVDKAVHRLCQGRHRRAALSRLRALVGRPCPAHRRRNAVHCRQPLYRQ